MFPRHSHQSKESLVLQREGEFEAREEMKNIKNTKGESKHDMEFREESAGGEEERGSEGDYGKDEGMKLGLQYLKMHLPEKE